MIELERGDVGRDEGEQREVLRRRGVTLDAKRQRTQLAKGRSPGYVALGKRDQSQSKVCTVQTRE